jgi:hypothetical protein
MNRLSSSLQAREPSRSAEEVQQGLVVMSPAAVAAGVTASTTVASTTVALGRFPAAKGMF